MIAQQGESDSFQIVTGLTFCRADRYRDISTVVSTTTVWPEGPYANEEIDAYLQAKDVISRPGAVMLDGPGVAFVAKIRGIPSNVAGLPLTDFVKHLEQQYGVDFRPSDRFNSELPGSHPLSVLSIGDINYDLIFDDLPSGSLRSITPPGLKTVGEIRRAVGGTAVQFARHCRRTGFEKLVVGGIFGADAPGEFIQQALESAPPDEPQIPIIVVPGRQPQPTKTSIAVIIREKATLGEADASLTITNADQHLPREFAKEYPAIANTDVVFVSGYALADSDRQLASINALKSGFEAGAVTVVDFTVDFDKSWKSPRGSTPTRNFDSFLRELAEDKAGSDSTVVDVLVSETVELIRWLACDAGSSESEITQIVTQRANDWAYIREQVIPKLRRCFRVAILRTPKYTEQMVIKLGDGDNAHSPE